MDKHGFRADDRLNQLNDRNDMWGPLLFLRPPRHQPMTPSRVLLIAALLGVFYGMLGNVAIRLLVPSESRYHPPALLMPLLLAAVYFICGQLSLVAAWNRRARLLSRRIDWAELAGRPMPPDDERAAD